MIFLSIQNFFDPPLTSDGKPYGQVKFKQIVSEQVTIGYLSQGGVSYRDTETMTPYERKIAYEVLNNIYEEQSKVHKKAMEEASLNRKNSSPRSGMTR